MATFETKTDILKIEPGSRAKTIEEHNVTDLFAADTYDKKGTKHPALIYGNLAGELRSWENPTGISIKKSEQDHDGLHIDLSSIKKPQEEEPTQKVNETIAVA